jgi:phosphatidylserine/phosphatidylglycerophosphate/cardiolipin synthase-like enzyme
MTTGAMSWAFAGSGRWVRRLVLLALTAVLAGAAFAGCGSETTGDEGGPDDGKADTWASSSEVGRAGITREHVDGWNDDENLDLYFVTYSDIEERVAEEVMRATREIRVAMYNVRSERLLDLLLQRQNEGLRVELLWDARQMAEDYNTLDDDFIARGLNIISVSNTASSTATLHDKLVVIDGEIVMMGSANWGDSAWWENNEDVLVMRSPALAGVVSAELDELLSGRHVPRAGDADSRAQLYFSPEDRLDRVVLNAINAAEDHILVAVFSLRLDSIGDALIAAHRRGVEVVVITDRKQSETTALDERIRGAGITVIEALNDTTPFTAMHHKFMVVDGRTTVVGSFNWTYSAARYNYEDLAVIAGDPEVAAAFEGEFGRLWTRYASELPNPVTATVPVDIAAHCDGTSWGDTVVLVGNLPELGSWDPAHGVALSGEGFPTWTGSLDLRSGAYFEYKLVIRRADGSVRWENGSNRSALLTTDPTEPAVELNDDFRL